MLKDEFSNESFEGEELVQDMTTLAKYQEWCYPDVDNSSTHISQYTVSVYTVDVIWEMYNNLSNRLLEEYLYFK